MSTVDLKAVYELNKKYAPLKPSAREVRTSAYQLKLVQQRVPMPDLSKIPTNYVKPLTAKELANPIRDHANQKFVEKRSLDDLKQIQKKGGYIGDAATKEIAKRGFTPSINLKTSFKPIPNSLNAGAVAVVAGGAVLGVTTAPPALVLGAGLLTVANISAYGKGTIDLIQANMGLNDAKRSLRNANQRYEDALLAKQKEAIAMDRARIDAAIQPIPPSMIGTWSVCVVWLPPFTNPSGCNIVSGFSGDNPQWTLDSGYWHLYATGDNNRDMYPPFSQSFGNFRQTSATFTPSNNAPIPPVVVEPQNPPTPYSSRDNWEYGQIPVTVGGKEPITKPSVKPLNKEFTSVKPFKEPDKQIDVEQPDTKKNIKLAKSPSGFTSIPSNQTVNNNIVINNTAPTPQTQGKTTEETKLDVLQQAQADFDKYYAVPYGGKGGFVKEVNSSFGTTANSDTGIKAFTKVNQKEQPYEKGTQVIPNKPTATPDTRPLNTTPTTPTTDNKNDSNVAQTIAGLLGLTALVTALKLGSDAFVNSALPKINSTAANTTPQAQQTNAKQGVCDAMQPTQCGFEGVKAATTQATQPIKDQAVVNTGLLGQVLAAVANILAAIANLASTIANLFGNVTGLVTRVLNNQLVHSSMSFMTNMTVLHNAAMLSRDVAETLGTVVDNSVNLSGQKLKDADGNDVSFTSWIGTNVRAIIVQVIGADKYVQLALQWQKASTIYHSAMAVVNTTQSMLDPLSGAIEYGMENVSRIGNGLREDGVVSENSYKAMDETIRARKVNRFERLNDTLEGAENISSNLASVTSSAVSVKEDYKQLREDTKDLKDKAAAYNTTDEAARTELKAALPTAITPLNLVPAPVEDEP